MMQPKGYAAPMDTLPRCRQKRRIKKWIPPPGGAGGVDLEAVHLAEVKIMEENKGYVLHFLEETEDIKIICEPWGQVKAHTRPPQEADWDVQVYLEDDAPSVARTTEKNETFQPEVLKETHPEEDLEASTKTEWVQAEGGVEADFGATVRRTARNEEANTPRKIWDEGDSQSVDHTSTSRQRGGIRPEGNLPRVQVGKEPEDRTQHYNMKRIE